jgi:ribosomal protein L18E
MKTPRSRHFLALFTAAATLATATLIDASSSSQVEQLGQMAIHRSAHKATALSDGRVLITGGRNTAGIVIADAEIFDPNTDQSSAVAPMATARVDHTATLLTDGRVLITGGSNATGTLNSAEIFDPNTGTFGAVSGSMKMPRAHHTATLLSSGKVLIAGGDVTPTLVDPNGTDVTGTAEMFDPSAGTFGDLVLLQRSRSGHTATLFSNDKVWLAGGGDNTIESFDASAGAFTLSAATMTAVRSGHEAFALSSISMLFFGGDTRNTIDEFNPSADTLNLKATMNGASSSATLLANGKILVLRSDAAGLYAPDTTDQATAFSLFDETSVPGSTALLRSGQTATELSGDKKILVTGGENAQHQPSLQIAIYNPARIWTDKDDYYPDDPVLLFGAGWKPSEDVYLYAVDSETEQWTYGSTVTADVQGSFSVEPYFIVQMRQLGTLFTVSAVGAQSNMQAEVEFTDAINLNSITVGPQTGTAIAGTASPVTYQVTASYSGNGANNDDPVTLSFVGWTGPTPAGVTPSFSTTTVTQGSPNSTLTLQTSSSTIVAGTYTFTVRGTTVGGQRKDGTGTLTIAPGTAAKLALSGSTSNLGSGSTRVLTATIQDANGNTVTSGPNSTLSVTFSQTAGTGSVNGLGSVNAVGGVATLTITGSQLGSVTISASAAGSGGPLAAGTGNPITFAVVAGAANKLALSGSTADLTAGVTRVLTATIQDINGNTVTSGTDSSLNVTFAKTAGTGTVTGLGSATASAGVATLTITGNGPGSITITASATGSGGALTPGTGNPISFNVVAGPASKVALSGSTANLTAGATRTLTATIQDSVGNTITTGADSTLNVTFAKTAGTGNVSGLNSVNAVAGIANLTVTGTTAGSVTIGVSATGSGGALAAGTGNPITFTVVASTTVDHFAFAPISSPQVAGTAFNVTITAQDTGNNTVTGYSGNGFKVKLTSTGALVGAPITTAAFTNGVLTNQSVTITNTGNFTITATDNGGGTATGASNSFLVNPGVASKLAFLQQPTTTLAGSTIAPPVTVQIQDANSNLTHSTASVAIAIQNNPSSGTLSATTPVNAVDGVATFSDLSINKGGTGYTLQATSTGLTSATSSSFTINNPAPTFTSISPTSGNLSQTLDVVFNGTNYIQGVSSVNFADSNITVNTTTVNSSIKITANITIGAGATVGAHNVSVTNSGPIGGTSATQVFTVNNPETSTAVISSLNPSTYGDSVTFTATVTSNSTPTGSVNFSIDGGASIAGTPGTTTAMTATWTYTTSALTAVTHTVSASFVHSTGSPFQDSNGSLSGGQVVNKAHLTVSADNKSKTYDGNTFTAFTATLSGFVLSQTDAVLRASGALSGSAGFTGPATTAVNASATGYTITPNQGTLTATNYDFPVGNFVDGTLTINKADANVTADDKQKSYGDDNPALTATVVGQPTNGDAVNYTLATTAAKFSNVGDYTITVTLWSNPNYNVTSHNGTLHINAKDASVTADDKNKQYGDDNPALTATVVGEVAGGDAINYTLDTTALKFSNVGNYPITVSLGSNPNYNITPHNGTLKIDLRPATVTADDKGKTYGDNIPVFTATVVGEVVGGDAINYSLSTTATKFSNVGDYPITVSLGSNPNYNVTPYNGTLHINAKDASVTADNKMKTYGDDNPVFTATVVGEVVGGDAINYTLDTTALKFSNVADYPITVTLGANPNYNVTSHNGTVHINAKDASVTADNKMKTYGDGNPGFTATVVGEVVGGDAINYTLDTTALKFSSVGDYPITVTLGSNPNYNVSKTDGNLHIDPKNASVKADPQSKTYGDDNPTLTATVMGTVNGDTLNYTLATTALKFSSVGDYPITVTLGSNPNYNVTKTDGTLHIGPKDASVTADNKGKVYGDDNPALTATLAGTVNGDVLSYTLATTAMKLSGVSDYPITVTLGSNPNYNVTKADGTLHISPRPATVTADNKNKNYGDDNPALTATIAGTVNGDALNYTLATTAVKFSPVGNYSITVTLGSNPNYTVTPTNGTLTVGKATPTLTWNTPAAIIVGTPLSATQLNATALFQGNPLPGSFTYSPPVGTVLPVAAQPQTLTATFTPTDTTNFVSGGQVTTTIKVQYSTTCIILGDPSHTILQPINPDGSSVSKAGSTVPAKFRVGDANCNSVGTPGVVKSFYLLIQTADPNATVNEDVVSTTPDTAFRWDPTAQQWIFNISTKGMKAGQKYTYQITLADGSFINFSFALK